MSMSEMPHWEHSYRRHGYWLDGKRIGYIGLPMKPMGDQGYAWCIEIPDGVIEGRTTSLKVAKREIEKWYRKTKTQ